MGIPRGLLGAVAGAIGTFPLLPVVRGFALRHFPMPLLPGAERQAGDVKAATYLEASVLLLAIPAAALLFGHAFPRLLGRRAGGRPALAELPGAGFGVSFVLWRLGARPVLGLALGALTAAGVATALLLLRGDPRLHNPFGQADRNALGRILAAGLAWGLACRSAQLRPAWPLVAAVLVSTLVLILLAHSCRRRRKEARTALVTEWLRRLGEFAWLLILLSGLALLSYGGAPFLLGLAAMLFLAAPFFFQAAPARRFLTRAAVLFFLFACGWTVFHQPGGPIDIFEDGQLLAPAQVYMTGGRPYLDTYPLHGWGADGGLDGILFRAFGPTLQTFWWRRAVMTALSLAALGAASHLLFGRMFWGGVGLLCALGFCPFVSERHLFIFAALCLLIRAGRNQRGLDWFLAGIASAVTLFFSLDFGLIAVAGGLAAAAILPLLDSKRSVETSIRRAVVFLGGTGLGSLPFFLLLARQGALSAFLRVSFREIPGTVTDTWGLPAGSPSAIVAHHGPIRALLLLLAGEETRSLFLLILLAAGVTVLLFRSARGVLEPVDRAAGTALAVACLSLRGVLGRADAGHLALYGVFGGLPAAWILYRAAHGGRHRKALSAAVLLLLLICLRLHRIVALEANAVRHAASALEPAVKALPSLAAARLPRAGPQAEELRALRRYFDATLQPGQTFFDFANQPALYFFLGRVPPIRYACVPFYEPDQKQREVVEALEGVRPPLAILSGGTFLDAPDGISNRQRAPLVAAYLDAHYEPAGEVSGRRIGRRKLP